MPKLSIVLPVYGVAGYLNECMDSILDQSFQDFEVIAVDDRSPDRSGEILDEYARHDSRIKVVHLEQNVGLGPARNAGTAEATGEYIWYVDSDDWLAPGALGAIVRRLDETRPDVLLIDFANVRIDRQARRSSLRRRVPMDQVADVFSAKDFPGVLRVLHTAWNRVLRREWLQSLDIKFQAAWYEDVSHTYAVVAAAERISVLYRVCYNYRIGRQGSITASAGNDRHFEVFDQYAIAMRDFDRLGINDLGVRVAMFNRMQVHYRWILGNSKRVPKQRRREFFQRMSADFRRYWPEGFQPEAQGVLENLKHRLLHGEAFRTFEAARRAKAVAGSVKRRYRRTRRLAGRTKNNIRKAALHSYYGLQRKLPLKKNLAVYTSYWGDGVRCNPLAIYETAKELAPRVHGVFVVDKKTAKAVPAGIDYAVIGSAKHLKSLARAKFLFNNVNFPPPYRKRKGSVFVQTHHGTPLKAMGMDHYRWPVGSRGMNLKMLYERCLLWDYSISTSPFNTEVWNRAYPVNHKILEFGYPRNDMLDTATPTEVAAARAKLGLRPDEQVVLYAPTHRDYQSGFDSPLDTDALAEALGPNFRVLLRAHHFYSTGTAKNDPRNGLHPRVLDVSEYPRVEDLYLASDVLITDYSSLMFDYAHLDRPIVIFAPDWEAYKLTRGVTFDLFATPPGVVATTFTDMVSAFVIGEVWSDGATKARTEFRERFCPHRDGKAGERVVRHVLLGEKSS